MTISRSCAAAAGSAAADRTIPAMTGAKSGRSQMSSAKPTSRSPSPSIPGSSRRCGARGSKGSSVAAR